jgi:hypothetical protein
MSCLRAGILFILLTAGCKKGLSPIPGTTTRIDTPISERGTELTMRIFSTEDECASRVKPEDLKYCLPNVDRGHAEVRLAFQLRDEADVFPLPLTKEHIKVGHMGRELQDGTEGIRYALIPHEPVRSSQLFILLIDGSSSMSKAGRLEKVRDALLLPEVKSAFFPEDVTTRVAIFQFTDRGPVPLGGRLRLLETPGEYSRLIRQELQVLRGYTHLFDAIRFATGPFLARKDIKEMLEVYEMTPTVVALTDGFNNQAARDTCRSNATRLNALLKHLDRVRSPEEGADPRRRPSVYTVGLGRPLRPGFKIPSEAGEKVRALDICGRKNVDRRIDGDLEERGIDNASLEWIARRAGGSSYVRQDKAGLGMAFQGAAAERYEWFEVRYTTHPFWLRRKFNTRVRLVNFATAEASVNFYPSAWLDAPPGRMSASGWSEPRSYRFTAVVLLPLLGFTLSFSFLGATLFNTRRVVLGRLRRPRLPVPTAPAAPPSPPPDPDPPSVV